MGNDSIVGTELRQYALAVLGLADPAAKAAQTRALFDAQARLALDPQALLAEPAGKPASAPTSWRCWRLPKAGRSPR